MGALLTEIVPCEMFEAGLLHGSYHCPTADACILHRDSLQQSTAISHITLCQSAELEGQEVLEAVP